MPFPPPAMPVLPPLPRDSIPGAGKAVPAPSPPAGGGPGGAGRRSTGANRHPRKETERYRQTVARDCSCHRKATPPPGRTPPGAGRPPGRHVRGQQDVIPITRMPPVTRMTPRNPGSVAKCLKSRSAGADSRGARPPQRSFGEGRGKRHGNRFWPSGPSGASNRRGTTGGARPGFGRARARRH